MGYQIDPGAIQLGACKIWYWDGAGWVSIGATQGGTSVRYAPQYRDVKIDQTGETVVKKILQGENGSISFGIAQSGLEKLQLAIPFGTIFSQNGKKAFGVGVNAGADMLDKTVKLKIHPINTLGAFGTDNEGFVDDDFIIWKAGNADAVEIPYAHDSERVYRVTMTMFPDFDAGAGRYLFVIGDVSVSGDDISPFVNGVSPVDKSIDVNVSVEPVVVMSEPLRHLSGGLPNAVITLSKLADREAVNISISSEAVIEGKATGGSANTIALEGGELSVDDIYKDLMIQITDGAGAGDTVYPITGYNGTTKTVSVDEWNNGNPDETSSYRIYATKIKVLPVSGLFPDTDYNLLVACAKDIAGNIQQSIFVSAFKTSA
jgi:hypothetical protein